MAAFGGSDELRQRSLSDGAPQVPLGQNGAAGAAAHPGALQGGSAAADQADTKREPSPWRPPPGEQLRQPPGFRALVLKKCTSAASRSSAMKAATAAWLHPLHSPGAAPLWSSCSCAVHPVMFGGVAMHIGRRSVASGADSAQNAQLLLRGHIALWLPGQMHSKDAPKCHCT